MLLLSTWYMHFKWQKENFNTSTWLEQVNVFSAVFNDHDDIAIILVFDIIKNWCTKLNFY